LIAFVATTPWDSYLIRRGIWSYPNDAIFGPAPLGIPLEEYTFFFVQTWITSLLYFLLSKPVFQPGYLAMPKDTYARIFTYKTIGRLGQFILATTFVVSIATVVKGGTGLYLGLILAWATPVLLLLW
jgi:15-cis-phytoene synthase / lycopene beta-cyclase